MDVYVSIYILYIYTYIGAHCTPIYHSAPLLQCQKDIEFIYVRRKILSFTWSCFTFSSKLSIYIYTSIYTIYIYIRPQIEFRRGSESGAGPTTAGQMTTIAKQQAPHVGRQVSLELAALRSLQSRYENIYLYHIYICVCNFNTCVYITIPVSRGQLYSNQQQYQQINLLRQPIILSARGHG